MKQSNEPIWWSLFAAGGVVAALMVPMLILLTGIAAPAGWAREAFTYDRVAAVVSHPLSRLLLFVVISLPLFHWAHRFRFTLVDLGLKGARSTIAIACYGAAVVGTVLAAFVLFML